jgi:hypothetical protein
MMDAVASAWSMIDAIVESRFPGVVAPSTQNSKRIEREKTRLERARTLPPTAVRHSRVNRMNTPPSGSVDPSVPKAALDQRAAQQQRQAAADKLAEELIQLTHQELLQAYRDALNAKMLEVEKKLFFNQPWASATMPFTERCRSGQSTSSQHWRLVRTPSG